MNLKSHSIYRQLRPGIVLGLCILFGLMILGDVNRVSAQFLQFRWIYFLYAILLSVINSFFRFLKRHYCLNRGGASHFSLSNSFHLFLASFPLAVTPMKIGESFKGIWLNRLSGVPVEKAVSMFLVDHISDGLSVFLLTIFGTIAFPELWPFFLSVLVLFLLAMLFIQIKPITQSFLNAGERMPLLSKGIPAIRQCVDGNPDLFSFGPLLLSSFLGLISWVAEGAALFIVLMGLGYNPSWALMGTSLLVFAFSMLMGIISAFPGGVGVMEVSMAALLTLILGFKPEVAAAATILFRLATFWFSFSVGVLIWFFTGKVFGIQNEEGRIVES